MFDTAKTGIIETIKISTILNTMGQLFDDNELQALIDENDPEGEYIQYPHSTLQIVFYTDDLLHKMWLSINYEFSVTGKVNFDGFTKIASHFLEEEDSEAMQQELKEAFRLYDREGNGYITTNTLKEILAALDDKLSSSDLDGIIAEIDTDGSGTVDFDGTYTNNICIYEVPLVKCNKIFIFRIYRIYRNDDWWLKILISVYSKISAEEPLSFVDQLACYFTVLLRKKCPFILWS